MEGITLDSGALIGLERRDKKISTAIDLAKQRGIIVTLPSVVIAEWWRGQGSQMARMLAAFDKEPLTEHLAYIAGEALAKVGRGPSIVDAIVAASAAQRGDILYTSDVADFMRLREYFPTIRPLAV